VANLQIQVSELDRFLGRYALGSESGNGSKHFLRIKVVGGILTIDQARTIAELSEKYGRGYLEVTTRHNIQLHWIRDEDSIEVFSKLEEAGLYTDMCGQHYPKAGYGDIRNITTCPFTGIQNGELFETYTIVRDVVRFFTGKKEYLNLPRKFKIGISACPIHCIKPEVNDLALIAVKTDHGLGFTPFIGGSIGYPPFIAQPLNIFIPLRESLEFIKTVVEIYNEHGFRERKSMSRFKWLVKELGVEKIKDMIEERIGKPFPIFDASYLSIVWREHDIIVPENIQGLYSLTVPTFTGLLNVHQFKEIINISERYSSEIRVSPSQKIIIPHIPREELDRVKEELKEIGLDPGQPLIKYRVRACPSDFCGKTSESSKMRAVTLLKNLEDELKDQISKLDITISISGCPNSCAQHIVSDIGLQSTIIRENEKTITCYNLYVRGSNSKLAKLLVKNIPSEHVSLVVEDILRLFIESSYENFNEFADELMRRGYNYGSRIGSA